MPEKPQWQRYKKCPYCDSDEGFITHELVVIDGKTGRTRPLEILCGCLSCHKNFYWYCKGGTFWRIE